MLNLKSIVIAAAAAAAALSTFGFSGAVTAADTSSGFYLDYSPGRSVEYLSLNDSTQDVIGYLEAIHASMAAADGQSRTQTFATRRGNSLSFGQYTAARTADGYTLTAMTREGEIIQQRFVRASIQSVNSSIVAFQASVVRNRIKAAELAKNAQLSRNNEVSADDSARLWKAEANINAAQAELSAAREVADRLLASARKARVDANAAIEKSGASLAQNQSRMQAMNLAGDAEQNEAVAEHRVDIAATAVGTARAEVTRLRSRVAGGADRSQASAIHVPSDDAAAP